MTNKPLVLSFANRPFWALIWNLKFEGSHHCLNLVDCFCKEELWDFPWGKIWVWEMSRTQIVLLCGHWGQRHGMAVRWLCPLSPSSGTVCGGEAVSVQIKVSTAKQQRWDLCLLWQVLRLQRLCNHKTVSGRLCWQRQWATLACGLLPFPECAAWEVQK